MAEQTDGDRHPERVILPYGDQELALDIARHNLLAVLSPRPLAPGVDGAAELARALRTPIDAPPLAVAASGARRVVIVADDMTRQTPVDVIIPLLLDELNAGDVQDGQVEVLIALGTHRPMSQAEIQVRFGPEVTSRVPVINSPWQDPSQLANLGVTPNGTPILVSRTAFEADFLVGLGSIVPHHIPGYSAGAKIVQPGISSAATTAATHLFSTRTRRSYLGVRENPVRAEMECIADRVGLKAVLNTVLDPSGGLVRAFYGNPRRAFRAGVTVADEVYGIPVPRRADIVIAGSHPCDLEFWQAHKALYPADIAVREGGTVIVVTPCPEGVSVTHPGMLNFTALASDEIEARIDDGTMADVVSGALALVWAKMRERANISLVSDGISKEEARALRFTHYDSAHEALAAALRHHGRDATITVLTHAPDTLPILES